MTRHTIRTMRALANTELRLKKGALRDCTDLGQRKRIVARIEELRACLADINLFAYDHHMTRFDEQNQEEP